MILFAGFVLLIGLIVFASSVLGLLYSRHRSNSFKTGIAGALMVFGGYVLGPATHPELTKSSAAAHASPAATSAATPPANQVGEGLVGADGEVSHGDDARMAAEQKAYERKARVALAAWRDHAQQGAPDLGRCDGAKMKDFCEASQVQFVTDYWRGAHHGNLEDAGNVAACLSDEGECGLQANQIQSCAWVLAALTSPDVSDTQAGHAHLYCGDLDDVSLDAAKALALRLVTTLPTFREPTD